MVLYEEKNINDNIRINWRQNVFSGRLSDIEK